jgi:DNA gyrase subunit A
VVGREGIEATYKESKGRVIMRARVVKEAMRGGKERLVVTELPYMVSKTKVIEQIAKLARAGRADDVSDIRDETDRDGMRLVIELKRGAKAASVLKMLYKRTHLQTTFGAHLLALDHGQPKEFDLKEMLERFRDHRIEVIQRRCRYELEKAEAERHVVEGLLAALDHIDRVIKIIRASKDRAEASVKLQDAFGLSDVQADAILNMRLARLTALERTQLEGRLAELESTIVGLREVLESEERQLQVLLDELADVVAKYGDARRTVILDENEEEVEIASVEGQLADEDVVVTLSHEGFVKRIPMHLYRRRVGSGKSLAGMERYEDDYLERVFVARTRGWILTFTENGHCHFLPVAEVPESARASRGQSVYALLDGAERTDRIVAMIALDELDVPDRFLVFLSKGGVIKRTPVSEFSNPRVGGVKAAGLKKDDAILDVALSDGSADVMLLSRAGRAIRFPEDDISVIGRTAQGVKGMSLKNDEIVGMLLIRRDSTLLTVSEDGLGKRTHVADFPLQKRGGLGTMAVPGGESISPIVSALEVLEADEVMVVTAGGQVTRVAADAVPVQGRRTQGRRMIALEPGDRVVEVTRAEDRGGAPARARPTPNEESPPDEEGQLDLLNDGKAR